MNKGVKVNLFGSNITSIQYLGEGNIRIGFKNGNYYDYEASEEIYKQISESEEKTKAIRELLINNKSIKYKKVAEEK